MVASGTEEHDDELKPVMLPSGGMFWVYERETGYFQERVRKYMKDNAFTNASDLAGLDQILMSELLMWRWNNWISQQKDYWGDPVNETGLAKAIKESSAELRQLKSSLGIDKVSRDKARGEGSVYEYLDNLRHRAKKFGVLRNKQSAKAIELFNDVKAAVTLHYNCTEDERQELDSQGTPCTAKAIMAWLRDEVIPQFDVLDETFRREEQAMWIRSQ